MKHFIVFEDRDLKIRAVNIANISRVDFEINNAEIATLAIIRTVESETIRAEGAAAAHLYKQVFLLGLTQHGLPFPAGNSSAVVADSMADRALERAAAPARDRHGQG